MSWTEKLESLQTDVDDLPNEESFPSWSTALRQVMEGASPDAELEQQHLDVISRLGWWLTVAEKLYDEFPALRQFLDQSGKVEISTLFTQLEELAGTLDSNLARLLGCGQRPSLPPLSRSYR
jgi:hypothetical protein